MYRTLPNRRTFWRSACCLLILLGVLLTTGASQPRPAQAAPPQRPAEQSWTPLGLISASPEVIIRDPTKGSKWVYAIGSNGQLGQISFSQSAREWYGDFPAKRAGRSDLTFLNSSTPAAMVRSTAAQTKVVYAVTSDYRLAQMWDSPDPNGQWTLNFPAELSGTRPLRFFSKPFAFFRDTAADRKTVVATTIEGHLVVLTNENGENWSMSFPAELAGYTTTGFQAQNSPAVFVRNAATNTMTIVAVTSNGRLAQLSNDGGPWTISFPADLAGARVDFQSSPAVLGLGAAGTKAIYAVTTDYRLIQLWDSAGRWQFNYPAELAGVQLPFMHAPAVISRDAAAGTKSIFAITRYGQLVEVSDAYTFGRWTVQYPAQPDRVFRGTPAVVGDDGILSATVYAITNEGRLGRAMQFKTSTAWEYMLIAVIYWNNLRW